MKKGIKYFKLLTPSKSGQFVTSVIAARKENGQTNTSHLLNERFVFSYLVYRSRLTMGASVNGISRETGLHKQTVAKAVSNLPLLVHQHENLWFANEPPVGWFSDWENTKATHWSDKLSYMMLYIPAKGARTTNGGRFGLTHAAVYSMIVSFTKKSATTRELTIALLSTLLNGMNRKSISAALDDLQSLKLIRWECKTPRLSITRLDFTEEHRQLFEPQNDNVDGTTVSNAKLPVSTKYTFKDDGHDQFRKMCESLMAQSYCERAIRAATYLGIGAEEFGVNLRDQKRKSDENVLAGKCSVTNFGKFFVTPLEQRAQATKEARKKEEAERLLDEYLKSPEYAQAQKDEDAAIEANPMHPHHMVTWESYTKRVRFDEAFQKNIRKANCFSDMLRQQCRNFSDSQGRSDREERNKLYQRIAKLALSEVNHHYGQEVLATTEELERAVDDAISEVQPGMDLLFAPASGETEVAHV